MRTSTHAELAELEAIHLPGSLPYYNIFIINITMLTVNKILCCRHRRQVKRFKSHKT